MKNRFHRAKRRRALAFTLPSLLVALSACGEREAAPPPPERPTAASAWALEGAPVDEWRGDRPPRFEDFPAAERHSGPPAPVDLESHPAAARHATVLREAAARGPDFAGRYTVVPLPADPRTTGRSFLVVDAATGRVHEGRTDAPPMQYRRDSRLIRFDAPEPLPGRVRCAGCTASYEVWDGGRLELVPPELWAPSPPPPEHARELVEHVRAEEEPAPGSFAPAVLRPTWDRLVITARDGTRRVFADEVVQGDLRSVHQFMGAPDPLPYFVVVRHLVPEGRAVLMVDRRTGQVLEVDDPPVPSPEGKRFVTASLDLIAGHLPNRVRVYRLTPQGPVVEWEVQPRDWGARNPVWVDSATIRLERGVAEDGRRIVTAPMMLRLRRGVWAVEP